MATLNPSQGTNVLKQEDNRAPVHTFNANDTPAQKGAIAGQERDKLESRNGEKPSAERELDLASAPSSGNVVPTIVVQDHDAEKVVATAQDVRSATKDDKVEIQDSSEAIPGAMPSGAAPPIPDWYVVGWRQHAGIDKPEPEGEARDKSVLDQFIHEQFYGAWYHNAAVIVFAVFVTHFLTRFGFGWGWLFIILAFCNTYYSNSMTKFRRNARDDIQRDLVKVRLGSEHETTEWMNQFLQRFWLIYEPILSQTITSSVDQILSIYTPGFLDSLRLTEFTLGTKAPRIDKVRTFPNTDDDIVMMDWAFSFTPKDTLDLTGRQLKNQVNPKIVLEIRLGKGLATAGMPVLVENIAVSGLMRVKLKLVSNFPHVQTVDISFMEEPTISYELKPIGGETFGLDIANVPGLSSFIRDTTHSVLRPMMYDPNVFTLNLEQMLSGKPLDTAIGVIEVTLQSARGIKGTKIGGGTPDPFVSLSINERAELARTKWKHNTFNPTWMETKYLLVNSLHDRLFLDLFDYNDHRSHTKLSTAIFELSALEDDATRDNLVTTLLKDGKERGELRYGVNFYPIIEPEEGAADLPDSKVGVVRVVIHQAKDLDNSKSMSGELNPMAKMFLNTDRKPAFQSRIYKHTNNPVWEEAKEYLCSSKEKDVITVRVIDDRDFLKDPCVGYVSIRLVDLLASKAAGKDWFPLSGCKSGKIRLSAEWKPVAMAGSMESAEDYTPPIGVVRLLINKAVDVKNVEATLGGKSDPYVRVQVRNVTKGRTEVIDNNLNPVWDEIVYIPVHSIKESLMLECMDYQHLTKDRSLGSTELHVKELFRETGDAMAPFESTGGKDYIEGLKLEKGNQMKGTLHYHATFIPCMKLKGIEFDTTGSNPLKLAAPEATDDEGGEFSDSSSMVSDDHFTPVELTIKSSKKSKSKPAPLPKISTDAANGVHAVDFGGTATQPAQATNDGSGSAPATPLSAVSFASATDPSPTPEGIEMPVEELLQQQSGIIVFNVKSGRLHKKGRIEVLMDDGYWPCFSTPKARSTNAQWDYVGEGFLKEIDFGQVWLRLDQAEGEDKDDIAAEWMGDAKAFLSSTLTGPQTFTLKDKNAEDVASVVIETRYIPVPVKLEARESSTNQGVIRATLLDAEDLRAADRGGKSDPFAVFTLNDEKVFKSDVKKKTLHPEWNENFDITVPSRVAGDLRVEVFDWNQIEQSKSLGEGRIDLVGLEPFQRSVQKIALNTEKHGHKGSVRVSLVFEPAIIAKSRKNTSTFTTTGRALTQIGGLPVKGGSRVLNVFKRNKDKGEEDMGAEGSASLAATGQASKPLGAPDEALNPGVAAFPTSPDNGYAGGSIEPGTLRVTAVDAKDLATDDWKPYLVLRVGDKEVKTKHTGKTSTPEWNESFKFAASSHTPKIHLWLHDHKTLGKDKEIGTGLVDIWRHIQPEGISAAEVLVQMQPTGQLRLRLEFDASTNPSSSGNSVSSDGDGRLHRTMSHVTASRFSLHRQRKDDE